MKEYEIVLTYLNGCAGAAHPQTFFEEAELASTDDFVRAKHGKDFEKFVKEVGRLSTKCNTFSENFGWSFPTKTLPGAIIDKIFNQPNIFIGNRPEIKTFRKEKSHNVVRILVCSALPRFMRLGKVDKSV